MYAGRRGRRPLPRTAPCPHTHTARRTRTPCPHTHAMRAPGRARRPRRAAPTGRHRGRPRARGPPGTSAPTTHRATSAHAHRAPHTHAMRVPGRARRPRRAVAHGTPTGARAARTSAPTTHRATSAHARHVRTRTPRPHTHAMRAPGRARRPRRAAPTGRPRDDIGDAHGRAGRRGRRPLPRSAPRPHTHTARRTRTPCAHLVGRDVLGAPRPRDVHGTTSGTPTGARAAGDVGPYHAPRHVRTRTPRAAHARHARTW